MASQQVQMALKMGRNIHCLKPGQVAVSAAETIATDRAILNLGGDMMMMILLLAMLRQTRRKMKLSKTSQQSKLELATTLWTHKLCVLIIRRQLAT